MSRPDAREHVFIVGCQRSGTTWLQLLLGRHPAVATSNETHLVSDYLGPLLRRWNASERTRRATGLRPLLSDEEVLGHLRAVARETLSRVADDGTRVVLEKTPQHALWGLELLELFPDARIVHLVRDPRDVTASLLAASEDWGSSWAADDAFDAAWTWRDYMAAASVLSERTSRFRELRYEDLYEDPARELSTLLDWIGLEAEVELLADAVSGTRLERLKNGTTEAPWDLDTEPEGFFRKGGSGNWREELSRSQTRVVEHVCRDLMEEKGYAPSRSSRLPPLALAPYWLRDKLRRRLCR